MPLALVDSPAWERPVRIAVLVVRGDTAQAEAVKLTGPMRAAVRAAFAHPTLAAPLRAVAMDPERLSGRIVARWEHPCWGDAQQTWEKSAGSTIVRWWIDPDDIL